MFKMFNRLNNSQNFHLVDTRSLLLLLRKCHAKATVCHCVGEPWSNAASYTKRETPHLIRVFKLGL